MKKVFLRSASLLTAAALTAGIMPAAAMAAEDEVYTLSNDYIKVEVSSENGGFHIGTIQGDKLEKDDDNKMLLHNSSEYDTSFTSFRITKNGESRLYLRQKLRLSRAFRNRYQHCTGRKQDSFQMDGRGYRDNTEYRACK